MFSSWTVDELLGEDETTVRFRVRQLTLQRVSTLVVTRAPLGDADAEALAHRLRAVSALRHPSLVELHDHGRLDDGRAFVVHACVDGDDLASEVARRGALPPHEVLELVEDICDAMALAHRAGRNRLRAGTGRHHAHAGGAAASGTYLRIRTFTRASEQRR